MKPEEDLENPSEITKLLMSYRPEPERCFSFEFEVWQGDEVVASTRGPRDDALREAMHYAAQYEQDGPVRVFEVTRTLVTMDNKRGTNYLLGSD